MAYNHYTKVGPWVPGETNFEPEHATHIEEGVEGNEQNVNIINYSLAQEWMAERFYFEFDLIQYNGLFYWCSLNMQEWCVDRGIDPIEWLENHDTFESQAQFWVLTENGDIGWIASTAIRNAGKALDDNKATQKSLEVTNRSLDALWKLNEGQTYEIETQTEQGTNIPPSGATHILDVAEIYGKSEQVQLSGKNLLNCNGLTEQTLNGVTFTPHYTDGKLDYININGTATTTTDYLIYGNASSSVDLMHLPSGNYTISKGTDNGNVQLLARLGGTNVVATWSTSTQFAYDGSGISSVRFRVNPVTFNNVKFYPQLEAGNTATDFEPFVVDNLLNPTLQTVTQNGVTCTRNGDGTYTLNGTANNTTVFELIGSYNDGSSYVDIGVNTYKLVDGITNSSGDTFSIYVRESDGSNITNYGYSYTVNGSSIFTTRAGYRYALGIRIVKGQTLNNVVFKPMLTTKLSATLADYISYRTLPSPSPSFPQPIKSIEELEFRISSNYKMAESGDRGEIGTEKLSEAQYKWLYDNYSIWHTNYSIVRHWYADGKVYVTKRDTTNPDPYEIFTVGWSGDISHYRGRDENAWYAVDYKGGLSPLANVIYAVNEYYNEPDSTKTINMPMVEDTHTIRLPKPLCSIGDYKDTIKVDEGVIERWIKHPTITGNENWGMDSGGTWTGASGNSFFIQNINIAGFGRANGVASIKAIICDKYIGVPRNDFGSNDNLVCIAGSGAQIEFVRTNYKTVAEWKSYVANADIQVNYILATPTTEPIPSDISDYLQSLEKLSADHTITVTDQEGRDASYVLDYIISLKEVR